MIFDNFDICNHIILWLKTYQIINLLKTCQVININLKLFIENLLRKKKNIENTFGKSIIEYLGGICNLLDINNYAVGNYQQQRFETSKPISLGFYTDRPFITFRLSNPEKLSEKYLLILYMTNHINNWSIISLDCNNKKINKRKPFDNFGNIISNGYNYNDNIKKNIQDLLNYKYCILNGKHQKYKITKNLILD